MCGAEGKLWVFVTCFCSLPTNVAFGFCFSSRDILITSPFDFNSTLRPAQRSYSHKHRPRVRFPFPYAWNPQPLQRTNPQGISFKTHKKSEEFIIFSFQPFRKENQVPNQIRINTFTNFLLFFTRRHFFKFMAIDESQSIRSFLKSHQFIEFLAKIAIIEVCHPSNIIK